MRVKNKHRLKHKESIRIFREIESLFPGESFFDEKKDVVEVGIVSGTKIFFVNSIPVLMEYNKKVFFTLIGLLRYNPKHRRVVVDMGAVPYVTNGADIMAPGIVDADTVIKAEEFVWVCDEEHGKPLAVGFSLMSGEEMKNNVKGKAVENIHWIGGPLWRGLRE